MKTIFLTAVALASTSATALATTTPGTPVPEIDAMAGFAALAVVGATVALIRGRSKR